MSFQEKKPYTSSSDHYESVLAEPTPIAYSKKLPTPQKVYVLDFFCGAGGMSYGFISTRQSHLGYELIGGIDIDPIALKTFEKNTGAKGYNADIAELGSNPEKLSALIPNWNARETRPLIFIGCAPCQGFSAHRKKDQRDDSRNSLIESFTNLVTYFRPDIVLMENVPEMLKGRFSEYYERAASKLRTVGYLLTGGVTDLSGFGVPQRRKRAVIMGSLRQQIELPKPPFAKPFTVRDAIGHLRKLKAGEEDANDPAHRAPAHTDRIVELFKMIPPDGGDRRSLPPSMQRKCHVVIDSGQTPGFTDVYGRLRWDEPSVTITAKSRSPSSGRFLHPEQHRNISVREAAILQGFPQSFVFEGSPTQQYRHIGEAVPPLFARFLAWSILDSLNPQASTAPAYLSLYRLTKPVQPEERTSLSVVECFCGAGGMALGFQAAGVEPSYAFDIDADAITTFRKNVATNAETISAQDPSLLRRIREAVGDAPYCIAGGPPCQGFSHQRRGDAKDPRNRLVLRYVDIVAALRPRPVAVVLENVTDLDLPRGRRILAAYLARLGKLGYVVFRHDLNSAEFSVPQLRNRIFIVALQRRIAAHYSGPQPLTANRWLTVGETLDGLEEPSPLLFATAHANHIASSEGAMNRRRIAYVDMGSGRKAIPIDLQLPCHRTSYRGHRDVYGRLDWFSYARTITAGFDSFTRGEFAHPFRHRSITPREAARLQGFPDWFEFCGNKASVRRQIGNAVPPQMSFAIAQAIRDALAQAGAR